MCHMNDNDHDNDDDDDDYHDKRCSPGLKHCLKGWLLLLKRYKGMVISII